jgi:Anti-sigma-K factor rskA
VSGGRPWWRAAAVPVAAALVALAVGVGLGFGLGRDEVGGGPSSSTVVAQLRPVGAIDPASAGTMSAAEQGGVRTMVIHLTGVTDTAGADYLEAWLMNRDGSQIIALGALTRGDNGYNGSFTVPTNLPLAQLDVADISAEHYDGNPGHSGLSILRGTLS